MSAIAQKSVGNKQQNKAQKAAPIANNSQPVQQPVISKVDSKQSYVNASENNNTKSSKLNETGKTNPLTKSELARKTNYTVYDVEAVHDDVKRSYVANPNLPHDPEAEYYETVRRLDVCGHCWAQQRKYCTHAFKPREKGPGTSLYQKDYVKHPIEKGPVMKNDFYTTFNVEEPMDLCTTTQKDYKDPHAKVPQRYSMEGKCAATGVPFGARSGYKTEYINWGAMPVHLEKAPHNITTIKDLPFNSKSAYQENFGAPDACEQARPVDRDLWNKNKKSPLSTGIPFLGQTTTGQTYKPYKVTPAPMFNTKEEYEPTESYPGQFNSTYGEEFAQQNKWKCPAKIFMETHPHPRGDVANS